MLAGQLNSVVGPMRGPLKAGMVAESAQSDCGV
jgi:hypothetical protein